MIKARMSTRECTKKLDVAVSLPEGATGCQTFVESKVQQETKNAEETADELYKQLQGDPGGNLSHLMSLQ